MILFTKEAKIETNGIVYVYEREKNRTNVTCFSSPFCENSAKINITPSLLL